MTLGKKAVFAAVTLLAFLILVEGGARVIWVVLEHRAFARTLQGGEAQLRNNIINFIEEPDRIYGYTLRPNMARGGVVINSQRFAQREVVPLARQPGVLRVAAMGESTTQGHNVDIANYPLALKNALKRLGTGFHDVEMINAGVSGWISDQVALRAEHEIARYQPDIVVLYVGWNDFQGYDPYGPPSTVTYFDMAYGGRHWVSTSWLRSVELLGAVVGAVSQPKAIIPAGEILPVEINYRFYIMSLDRIVRAFRGTDPKVTIAISTLVGRWPLGTVADYEDETHHGRTWWMKLHSLTPTQASAALDRFNDLIRQYARRQNLILIDAARAFDPLDRRKLQWDFAHMDPEGYELLGHVMYRGLVDSSVVAGGKSERMEELVAKYRRAAG
jgi:lysophospholipase L1-like esterase